jgi:hypothetical protein
MDVVASVFVVVAAVAILTDARGLELVALFFGRRW